MADRSGIEWCDATWNALLGCSKCSEGCRWCYAIRTAWRLMHNPNPKIAAAYAGLVERRADGSLQWGEWRPSTSKPVRGQAAEDLGICLLPTGRAGCQGDWWDGKAAGMKRVGKKAAGRLLDGVEHNELPKP